MKQCAFLTMDDMGNYVNDDGLAIEALEPHGWNVSLIPWRSTTTDWDLFDLVVIRSTWDYHEDPDAFIHTLRHIEQSRTRLENPADVVSWNINKRYLQSLANQGIYTVDTQWGGHLTYSQLASIQTDFGSQSFIVKPIISASAMNTFHIHPNTPSQQLQHIAQTFSNLDFMVQPFMKCIVEEGEYSLFFFNGSYSHTILKTPKQQDFRVQEEYGGHIKAVSPPSLVLHRAQECLDALDKTLLYARVDLVRDEKGDYALMELELIEPSLYLRMDAQAPERFAQALDSLV